MAWQFIFRRMGIWWNLRCKFLAEDISSYLVRGFLPPHSLRHPLLDLASPPLLKSLFPLLSFLFHSLLRYFRQFPHPHATPFCPNPSHKPYLHIDIGFIIIGFKQILKGWFYKFNYRFISKTLRRPALAPYFHTFF